MSSGSFEANDLWQTQTPKNPLNMLVDPRRKGYLLPLGVQFLRRIIQAIQLIHKKNDKALPTSN